MTTTRPRLLGSLSKYHVADLSDLSRARASRDTKVRGRTNPHTLGRVFAATATFPRRGPSCLARQSQRPRPGPRRCARQPCALPPSREHDVCSRGILRHSWQRWRWRLQKLPGTVDPLVRARRAAGRHAPRRTARTHADESCQGSDPPVLRTHVHRRPGVPESSFPGPRSRSRAGKRGYPPRALRAAVGFVLLSAMCRLSVHSGRAQSPLACLQLARPRAAFDRAGRSLASFFSCLSAGPMEHLRGRFLSVVAAETNPRTESH